MQNRIKLYLALLLFGLGLFVRLPVLTEPRQIVFDEIYFGDFATHYCCDHKRFFDIHPPHAKLIIAGVAKLFGHSSGFQFKNIGQPYDDSVAIFGLRFVPALTGALIPALVAVLIWQLGGGLWAGFLCGFALCFDNAMYVQSTVIALDPILISAFLCAMIFAVKSSDSKSKPSFIFWMTLSGICSGLAVGTKFTGLTSIGAALGLLVLLTVVANDLEKSQKIKKVFIGGIVFFVAFISIYLGGWYLHFKLLNLPGSGDAFMIPSGFFLEDTIKLHKTMLQANAGITTQHPYASHWYTWPYMQRPIFYWQNKARVIYFAGNPVVWLGALVAWTGSVLLLFKNIWQKRLLTKNALLQGFLLICIIISLAPMAAVHRPLFLYHYLPTLCLLYLMIGIADWTYILDTRLGGILGRYKYKTILSLCSLILIGYVLMMPLTHGIEFGSDVRRYIQDLIPGWR